MVISCVKLVAHVLPEDAATPPTDKILQSGVRVGAKAKEDLKVGLGLPDYSGAVEGVQPHTGHRLFHTGELRVGKHKAIAGVRGQHGQNAAQNGFGKSGDAHLGNDVRLMVGRRGEPFIERGAGRGPMGGRRRLAGRVANGRTELIMCLNIFNAEQEISFRQAVQRV